MTKITSRLPSGAILLQVFLFAYYAVCFVHAQTLLPTSTPVEFHDINILVVTDVHSWIASHLHPDHTPPLTATYGSIASAVTHVKALAASAGRDVFFLNNGDHVEGGGLSDASVYTTGVHGYDLFPLIGLMPFDALHLGKSWPL